MAVKSFTTETGPKKHTVTELQRHETETSENMEDNRKSGSAVTQ